VDRTGRQVRSTAKVADDVALGAPKVLVTRWGEASIHETRASKNGLLMPPQSAGGDMRRVSIGFP